MCYVAALANADMKVVVLLFFLALFTPAAVGCVCNDGPATALLELKSSNVVFVGTVSHIEESKRSSSDGLSYTRQFLVTFRVRTALKGVHGRNLILKVGTSDCDIRFSTGDRWLVYAFVSDGSLSTSGCTRTKLAKHAADDLNCIKHSRCVVQCRGCISKA